jgi:hypothetical protein
MTNRPSLWELLGVWLVGAVGAILAYDLVKDLETVLTVPVVAAGLVLLLTPPFLVVYSLVWAWPLASRGDRAAVSALVVFAVVVEAISGSFWIGAHAITITSVGMRILALFNLLAFGACAVSAAWAYARRASFEEGTVAGQRFPQTDAAEAQRVRDQLMAMLVRRAHRASARSRP